MMSRTNLRIAGVHLTSRVKQALIAMLSVTFGISMYIFMNSFMTGVNETQTEMAFSTLAHVRIYNDLPEDRSNLLVKVHDPQTAIHVRNPRVIQYTEGIKNSPDIIRRLKSHPNVAAIAPQVNINVFYRNGATRINGTVSGVDAFLEDQLFATSTYMTEGDWFELQNRGDGIVMGVGLAKKLSIGVGDRVLVQTADGVNKSYKLLGLLETSIVGVDNFKAYLRINSARQLLSENQAYATDIQINLREFEASRSFATRYDRLIPYKVEAWQTANGQLDAGNELRNIIAIAVSLTILIVAGFGIYNIMNMTVNEKIREIAILKAMGFEGRDIVQIFLTQSVIIGLFGGLAGIILGYVFSMIIDHMPFEIAMLETLPIAYRPRDYAMGFLFGLITTFLAGYLPARKAAQVDPVDIIRG